MIRRRYWTLQVVVRMPRPTQLMINYIPGKIQANSFDAKDRVKLGHCGGCFRLWGLHNISRMGPQVSSETENVTGYTVPGHSNCYVLIIL